jgi:hypothetical protein
MLPVVSMTSARSSATGGAGVTFGSWTTAFMSPTTAWAVAVAAPSDAVMRTPAPRSAPTVPGRKNSIPSERVGASSSLMPVVSVTVTVAPESGAPALSVTRTARRFSRGICGSPLTCVRAVCSR